MSICYVIVGCDSSKNIKDNTKELATNPWVYSEKTDKMTDERVITATAMLEDEQVPNVMVQTFLDCTDSKVISIKLTAFDEKEQGLEIKTDGFDLLGRRFEGAKFLIRSGENKFEKYFVKINYTNSVDSILFDSSKSSNDENKFLSNINYPNQNFLIRIPTVQGSPAILIDMKNEIVKKIFNSCIPS